MLREHYQPPSQEQWQREILDEVERIKKIPEPFLQQGVSLEATTRSGERVRGQTYSLDLEKARIAGIEGIQNPHIGHYRVYLIATDASDRVVGTRITTLFTFREKVLAASFIKVLDKGRGFAFPIEQMFEAQLKTVADASGKPVVWQVTNENLERLKELKEHTETDPKILKELEEEQERWQALYGNGGKLDITNGKKTFVPRTKV